MSEEEAKLLADIRSLTLLYPAEPAAYQQALTRAADTLQRTLDEFDLLTKANNQLAQVIQQRVHDRELALAALLQEHRAMDLLLALLVQKDPDFFPTKSAAWPALENGARVLRMFGKLGK